MWIFDKWNQNGIFISICHQHVSHFSSLLLWILAFVAQRPNSIYFLHRNFIAFCSFFPFSRYILIAALNRWEKSTVFKVANKIREKERERKTRVRIELKNKYSISLKLTRKKNFSIHISNGQINIKWTGTFLSIFNEGARPSSVCFLSTFFFRLIIYYRKHRPNLRTTSQIFS